MEIDIKYVLGRIRGKRYYQYTAIDCATRWRHLEIYENGDNDSSLRFLEQVIKTASFPIRAIKTDNGTCFTNRYVGYLKSSSPHEPRFHPLDERCAELGIVHYLIDPGKPAQNGKVERSHRTDQEMFYDRHRFDTLRSLQISLRKWNNYYNNLEHCALDGLSPNEALARVQNVCA